MLEARGLCKVYVSGPRRVEAVAGVSLRVERGEFVAIRGRSGSGKSTLLAMLGGQCRPSAGSVLLDGSDVWKLSHDRLARLRGLCVGFVFQSASLLPSLRAIDNVALPALLSGHETEKVRERAATLLAEVGLDSRLDAFPAELSGGEQRRVAVARALVNRPDVLLADEPTSDLDEQTEAEVFDLLLDMHRRHGTTLVVVTHNASLASRADRVIVLRDGRVVSEESRPDRTPVPVLERPAAAPPVAKLEPLGAGFGRSLVGVGVWLAALALTLTTVNYGVSLWQQRLTQARQAVHQATEAAALAQLRADIDDLALGPAGTFRLTLYLKNTEPGRDLFVTTPAVGVFIQVGGGWQEVPVRPLDHDEGRVISLTGKQQFAFTFEPKGVKYEEILPGYMHVRIVNAMLVSPSGTPGSDLFERSDNYYVWLLPQDADLEKVSRENRFPGRPPLWIPMPTH